MKKMVALVAVAVAVLAGCSTPADLKADRAPTVFTVPVGYQLVLKRLVEQHQVCAMVPLIPIGQVINDVQNYPDLRMATITRGASGIGTQTTQVLELREVGAGQTEVKLYQRFAPEKFAKAYERNALGENVCP